MADPRPLPIHCWLRSASFLQQIDGMRADGCNEIAPMPAMKIGSKGKEDGTVSYLRNSVGVFRPIKLGGRNPNRSPGSI